MAAVFTAADISTLSTSVSTIVVALVGISLIFVARKYLSKSGIR